MHEFFYFLGWSFSEFLFNGVVTRVIRLVLKAAHVSSPAASLMSFVIASAGLTFLDLQFPPSQPELSKVILYQEITLGIWLLIDLFVLDKRAVKAANKVSA